MEAMVMTFPVSDSTILNNVAVGSSGVFTLKVSKGFATVTKAKILPKQVIYRCPMHPDEISNKPGRCPKCGMDLVRQD